MKSIEQLLELSRNPHYQLTEEEVRTLQEYQKSQSEVNRVNKNRVTVHSPSLEKHNPELSE